MKDKLDLFYKNITGLHKKVDSLHPQAGEWKVGYLKFKDPPEEEFILRHRDFFEAVKSLWRDPVLADHLVYRPRQVSPRRNIYTQSVGWEMVAVYSSAFLFPC